jgi:hypothetical protein
MVTSRDVARRAGVSQATASRVLHDNPKLGQKRHRRVLESNLLPRFATELIIRGLRRLVRSPTNRRPPR